MFGPNQTKSVGTGVGAGIVVATGLSGVAGGGVSGSFFGMLQAVTDSTSNMMRLKGIMFWQTL
jgi:hypothetical protein